MFSGPLQNQVLMLVNILNICDIKVIKVGSFIFLSKYTLINCLHLCWVMLYSHSLLVIQIKLVEGLGGALRIISPL